MADAMPKSRALQMAPGTPEPGQLTVTARRRAKPPRHLADRTNDERRDAVVALGEQAFRGKQLSKHYFERLFDAHGDDHDVLTDLPARARGPLVEALLPKLVEPVRRLECDGGMTV